MTMRERWIESFEPSVEIYLLKEKGEAALYLTRDKPGTAYPRTPMYHVWNGDNWMYCGWAKERADVIYKETTGGVQDG